jgi:hypothetical protein
MRPSFRKEFWGPPSSSSCVTVSTEGIIAVATISSLHVMLPTLDPCGFEYTWAYIDSEKLKPTFLVDRTVRVYIKQLRVLINYYNFVYIPVG